MTPEETKKAIAVMQHYADGGEVESSSKGVNDWKLAIDPYWQWYVYDYRIKRTLPEVGKWYGGDGFPKFKCVAYNFNKYVFMYEDGAGVFVDEKSDFSIFKEVQP